MTHPDTTRCQRAVATSPEAPACLPTFTLDRHIAQSRREMGEARWAELNAEWEAPFAAGLIADMEEGCA
ncbi:hypothetical protein [Novosphingobium sp. RL4]|uniref:hypothetical protein n=1 Tax=Novosphingobium sp. RL4 TaxID=3109595 RepID=UPI002D77CF02|nr:hypothetical protein [Novosphingobium sp. RL4]WRT91881.1 hypothetical protein U9J33_11730 [Novosphingobium sp. RL4]